jgi:hypothetical protein
MLPYESVIVAALTFGAKLLDFAAAHREGMSQANRDRLDAVQIAGLERVEKILSALEGKQ